jgi:NTP pyrophosphatase (non-canonical NTP hydrolase)
MSSLTLREFQSQHQSWLDHNFPRQAPHQPLLGMVEELGELSHAHLKYEQSIRDYDETQFRSEAIDAIGDLMIYLASYCNTNRFDLQACLEHTWDRVRQRDWVEYPGEGVPT